VKRLLRRIRGPTEEDIQAELDRLVEQGLVEIHGYDHGEPLYRLTEKGLEWAKDIRRRRP